MLFGQSCRQHASAFGTAGLIRVVFFQQLGHSRQHVGTCMALYNAPQIFAQDSGTIPSRYNTFGTLVAGAIFSRDGATGAAAVRGDIP
jgi:hypothetical protein